MFLLEFWSWNVYELKICKFLNRWVAELLIELMLLLRVILNALKINII